MNWLQGEWISDRETTIQQPYFQSLKESRPDLYETLVAPYGNMAWNIQGATIETTHPEYGSHSETHRFEVLNNDVVKIYMNNDSLEPMTVTRSDKGFCVMFGETAPAECFKRVGA